MFVFVPFVLISTSIQSFGIVGLGIERQCTNIVVSWPSQGYEYYLIQYRPTLDSSTPWTNLTNNYPANSANRTTFTIFGVTPPCSSGGGGSLMAGVASKPSVPMVVRKDESRAPVPLAIYPWGVDLTGYVILWPDGSTDEWSKELGAKWRASLQVGQGDPQPEDNDGDLEVDSGFYRVFHIPNWSVSITNYVFNSPILIPIDFKDYRDRMAQFEVLINGERTDFAELTYALDQNGNEIWGAGVYFDRFTNGIYPIQLRTTLNLDKSVGDDTPFLLLTNKPLSITVSNLVMYTDWDDLIVGSNYTFKATCVISNVNWEIDIYDAWGFPVNLQTGTSTNGRIEWTWDLTDFNGFTRDSLDSDPFFDPILSFSSATLPASTNTSIMPINGLDYPDVGAWITAYLDRVKDPNSRPYYIEAMEAISGAVASTTGIPTDIFMLRYGPDAGPDPVTAQANRNEDWYELRSLLGNRHFRNLYYSGHGSASAIGGDFDRLDANGNFVISDSGPNSTAYISCYWWRDNLTKNKRGGAQPYRFVFLDGCQTAAGDWPAAVGTGKVTNSLAFYQNPSLNKTRTRPLAFVGWETIVGGPNWGFLAPYKFFRTEWINQWTSQNQPTLVQSLGNANQNAAWVSAGQLWGSLRVYGYHVLKANDYNYRKDWTTQ